MHGQLGWRVRKPLIFASCFLISLTAPTTTWAHQHLENSKLAEQRVDDSASPTSSVVAIPSAKPRPQPLKALRITAANAASLIKKGPDAVGGINDWFISNGTLCAIISDAEHEHEFSTKGGVLVDLGFCDREDDHYTSAQDLIDGKRERPLDAISVSSSIVEGEARITVNSATLGASQVTTYSLNLASPTQLHITKTLTRPPASTQGEEPNFNVYTSLHFNYHSLEPFVFSSRDITKTNGFENEDFVSRGLSALSVASRHADTIITISPPTAVAPISYGWHLKSARRINNRDNYEVPSFVLADDESNAFLILVDTFYIGDGSKIGWLQLPQIPLLTLAEESRLEINEVIYVGQGGDVASITDQLLTDRLQKETQLVSGRAATNEAALHIDQEDGTPLTHVRPSSDGSFNLRLPAGDYQLRQIASAKRQTTQQFSVADKPVDLSPTDLEMAATLSLPSGEAMRLVFVGLNGTADPNFTDTYTDASIIDDNGVHFREAVSQVFLAGLSDDKSQLTLAPGDYRVYATRGPEYSLEKTQVTLKPGSNSKLDIKIPEHRVPTPNFIASDLHVHSGSSFDNTFSDTERVRTFVAEHGEVMVSSEHDIPVDFSPLIKSMGAQQKITSIAAAEVTSLLATPSNPFTGGHSNFFPYQPEPHEHRRGIVSHEGKRLREVIHSVKQKHPDVLVQLNHPRLNSTLSDTLPNDHQSLINSAEYLEHMGAAGHPYNPNKPLSTSPNNVLLERDPASGLRDLDFDLIEVINPGGEYHEDRILAVRRDWLSFLKQGEKIVATANSDSHTSQTQVGLPRTMVAMKDDRIANFDQAEFITALKAGNAYGSTGPLLEIALSDKAMGETFKGREGQLELTISSADWIDVDTAKIQINGITVDEYELSAQNVHSLSVPMVFERDSFVTVEVSGPASDDYETLYPGLTPYAFTNPIYVDFDSDGEWRAPGL